MSIVLSLEAHRKLYATKPHYKAYVIGVNRSFKVLRAVGTARAEIARVGWDPQGEGIGENSTISVVRALEWACRVRCDNLPGDEFVIQAQMAYDLMWSAAQADTWVHSRYRTTATNLSEWENLVLPRYSYIVPRMLDKAYSMAADSAANYKNERAFGA